MVERTCLESRSARKGTQGSNPCLSAIFRFAKNGETSSKSQRDFDGSARNITA